MGIGWQGSLKYAGDAYRSIPLRHFAPLGGVRGVELFSLQKNAGREQIAELSDDFSVTDFGPELDDQSGPFMDTAAIMQNLDLIVTSDTAIAHLAGAMGLPAWVALGSVADWRWLEQREDCPWYPTMRLFRQSCAGQWDTLLERIADELREVVAGDRSKLGPESAMVPAAIHVPVAAGELLDKITILQIKSKRISDENRLANVRRELNELSAVYDRTVVPSAELTAFGEELRTINAELWDIEDEIRRCEARKEFADRFVELAWAVYRTNDRRAAVKRQIDVLTGSKLVEEKQYESYE